MATNPLTLDDLITRAIEAGEIVKGINDPETLRKIKAGRKDIQEGRVHSEEEVDALIERWATE